MKEEEKGKVVEKLMEVLGEAFDKMQERPDQFVVAYYRVKDDTLIGYHCSTFCQVTDDLLRGKRYAGENPYPQLEIIAKNLRYTLDTEHKDGLFSSINKSVQKNDFGGLKSNEVYMDAIYLADGTPKQSFRYTIISP